MSENSQETPQEILQGIRSHTDSATERLKERNLSPIGDRTIYWANTLNTLMTAVKNGDITQEQFTYTFAEYLALLQVEGSIESMTQIWNRAGIDTISMNALRHSQTANEPLIIAMVDLDKFKAVNDTYGHDAGDVVLKEFADTFDKVRQDEVIGRYGGEEFLVVLPGKDTEKAGIFFQKLADSMKDKKIDSAKGQFAFPTLSIGYAQFTPDASSPKDVQSVYDSLKAQADTALYVAKGKWQVEGIPPEGRNRAFAYNPIFENHKVV